MLKISVKKITKKLQKLQKFQKTKKIYKPSRICSNKFKITNSEKALIIKLIIKFEYWPVMNNDSKICKKKWKFAKN